MQIMCIDKPWCDSTYCDSLVWEKSNIGAFLDWINKEVGYIFGEYIKQPSAPGTPKKIGIHFQFPGFQSQIVKM